MTFPDVVEPTLPVIQQRGQVFGDDPFVTRAIVLDWSGGLSRIHPQQPLAGVDLELFPVPESGSLADHADEFKESVRRQVARILNGLTGLDVTVRNDEASSNRSATVVYLVQGLSPSGALEAGEGEFDPCDQEPDNQALVFAERLRQLFGEATREDWVLAFANVTAHELGHTLGFNHVSREGDTGTSRSLYVELMLEGHTAHELRREQRILFTDHCTAAEGGTLSHSH